MTHRVRNQNELFYDDIQVAINEVQNVSFIKMFQLLDLNLKEF